MTMHSDQDFMQQAIAIGEKGRVTAPPNPWVGCIIVKNQQVIGSGYHISPGMDHAEIVALKEAGENACGATVYVTLEPCCHYGRTPPCVNALIKAKVARVIVALEDPDKQVAGKGIEQLKQAGIEVRVGVCQEEAAISLMPYLHHRKTGTPWCVAKAAISIDGRIAAQDGSSQWISSHGALRDAHHLRSLSQAILIGINTAIQDKPQLTVRLNGSMRQPLRVVLDPQGKLQEPSPLLNQSTAKTVIITSSNCPEAILSKWKTLEVEVLMLPVDESGHFNLRQVLTLLGDRGVLQLLIEGGAKLLGIFLNEKLIDQLVLYVGDKILGDRGKPLFEGVHIASLSQSPSLRLLETRRIENSVRLDYLFLRVEA